MVELLVTIVVIGLLSVFAVPSFTGFMQNNHSESLAAQLTSAFSLARSESLERGVSVSVCAANAALNACETPSQWENGWLVFSNQNKGVTPATNADIIQVFQNSSKTALTASRTVATFEATGFAEATSANMTLTLAPSGCTGNNKRTLTITKMGRVSITRSTCP